MFHLFSIDGWKVHYYPLQGEGFVFVCTYRKGDELKRLSEIVPDKFSGIIWSLRTIGLNIDLNDLAEKE